MRTLNDRELEDLKKNQLIIYTEKYSTSSSDRIELLFGTLNVKILNIAIPVLTQQAF